MAGVGLVRLGKELKMLTDEPPPGVCAWPVDDCITHLQAQIQGPEDTPYERGTFLLDLQIPDRYPFEPPKVRFVTPIYHPNIDSGGRICLDTLKMRPAGSWAPSMNVPTLLTTIRLLMAHPNGDDGLMPDITELFLKNPSRFADVARAHVEEHARQDTLASSKKAKAKATPEGSPATAATTGDVAETARGGASPNAVATAASVPASSAGETWGSRSPEKGAGGGDKTSSVAETATAAAAAAAKAGEAVGETLGEGAAAAEKGQKAAGEAAAPVVDARRGEEASGGDGGSATAAAAAAGNDPQDAAESGRGGASNAGCRNSDDGGGESSGSERGESRKVGSDGDGASSDDGAWSDSDDENDDDGSDDGPTSAKRPRTAM